MKPEDRQRIRGLLVLVFVIALSILLFVYRSHIHELEALGYPGIFLVSLLSNASLILPVPGVLFTSAMGAIFNPFWVAIAAGCGSALGELSGYLAGYSGQRVVTRSQWTDRLENWMRRYGDATVLVVAIIPNPLFDVVGILAGGLKMPIWRFLLWCWLGKTIKMLLFAYGGDVLSRFLPQ
ncbi:predicted membrane protein [Longilinea arvoryzae]|uniref:Predicted membrane protein n=1 Tax=Longilinea arvoryzae TaxID=360412 RepID=A0A0S7BA20_9CHLR|nr:VTT domain-containing protein [Longilinea arvoryzae]GAP14311.1 predicted membrane protein [Longilinea arvoryzae]